MLKIPSTDICYMYAPEVQFFSMADVQRSLCTDCEISGGIAGSERELQKWMGDGAEDTMLSLDGLGRDPNEGCSRDDGTWDQFAANNKLFGYESTWDENLYTTSLDKSKLSAEQQARAAEIAREIEQAPATNNLQWDIERNKKVDDIDEETLYSAVVRDLPPDGSPEDEDQSGNAVKKYIPPHKRKAGAKPAPATKVSGTEYLRSVGASHPQAPIPESAVSAAEFEKNLVQQHTPNADATPSSETTSAPPPPVTADTGSISWADSSPPPSDDDEDPKSKDEPKLDKHDKPEGAHPAHKMSSEDLKALRGSNSRLTPDSPKSSKPEEVTKVADQLDIDTQAKGSKLEKSRQDFTTWQVNKSQVTKEPSKEKSVTSRDKQISDLKNFSKSYKGPTKAAAKPATTTPTPTTNSTPSATAVTNNNPPPALAPVSAQVPPSTSDSGVALWSDLVQQEEEDENNEFSAEAGTPMSGKLSKQGSSKSMAQTPKSENSTLNPNAKEWKPQGEPAGRPAEGAAQEPQRQMSGGSMQPYGQGGASSENYTEWRTQIRTPVHKTILGTIAHALQSQMLTAQKDWLGTEETYTHSWVRNPFVDPRNSATQVGYTHTYSIRDYNDQQWLDEPPTNINPGMQNMPMDARGMMVSHPHPVPGGGYPSNRDTSAPAGGPPYVTPGGYPSNRDTMVQHGGPPQPGGGNLNQHHHDHYVPNSFHPVPVKSMVMPDQGQMQPPQMTNYNSPNYPPAAGAPPYNVPQMSPAGHQQQTPVASYPPPPNHDGSHYNTQRNFNSSQGYPPSQPMPPTTSMAQFAAPPGQNQPVRQYNGGFPPYNQQHPPTAQPQQQPHVAWQQQQGNTQTGMHPGQHMFSGYNRDPNQPPPSNPGNHHHQQFQPNQVQPHMHQHMPAGHSHQYPPPQHQNKNPVVLMPGKGRGGPPASPATNQPLHPLTHTLQNAHSGTVDDKMMQPGRNDGPMHPKASHHAPGMQQRVPGGVDQQMDYSQGGPPSQQGDDMSGEMKKEPQKALWKPRQQNRQPPPTSGGARNKKLP
eukprot:TRINITY_DN62773_c0_g1_i1.p1 TRINITY_DN62773_c0_g1~~TRINITY_DN62773_c0_g1_i1.p1  ORF type:complete len:1125 (+),score=183.13 TRINITY_DN62773_c0_g1_i1:274-3375(+)